MEFEFRLFGPRKGQTVTLNGHQFVNGICRLVQSSVNLDNAARVFSFYNAYARGTPEYDVAMALEEATNGADKVSEAPIEGIDNATQAGVQPDGGGSPEDKADAGVVDADPSGANSASAGSPGDGHEHSGVPKFPEDADYRPEEPASSVNGAVVEALKKLDPDVNSHWVMTGVQKGKPKLQAVEDAYGKAGLTRQDLEAAAPGFDRDAAIAAALPA
jgi:hypothetical protein